MSKSKFFRVMFVLLVLSMATACSDDTEDTVPDIGIDDADEIIEDTVDAVNTGVSALCKACTFANGEGSDSCTGVCE